MSPGEAEVEGQRLRDDASGSEGAGGGVLSVMREAAHQALIIIKVCDPFGLSPGCGLSHGTYTHHTGVCVLTRLGSTRSQNSNWVKPKSWPGF